MLIKSTSRKDTRAFQQLIAYTLGIEEERQESEVIYTHNLRGNSPEEWINEFNHNETFRVHRRKNSVRLYHEIMSFSPEDSKAITRGILQDLVQEYISKRASSSLVLAIRHTDTDHDHIHLIISGIAYRTGRVTSISKQKFAQIKKEIETIQRQRYPQLEHSYAQDKWRSRSRTQQEIHSSKSSLKDWLIYTWKEALKHARDLKDLSSILKQVEIEIYHRRGKATGLRYMKRKFRFSSLGITPDHQIEMKHPEPPFIKKWEVDRQR